VSEQRERIDQLVRDLAAYYGKDETWARQVVEAALTEVRKPLVQHYPPPLGEDEHS